MSNLLATLGTASGALDAFNQVLSVVQNNVANASTPGYANQTQILEPLKLNPDQGFPGGVTAGQIVSSRDEYAEQSVQQQTTLLGQAQQDVNSLTALESQFDVTGASGISAALNSLFAAFSAWGQTPSSTVAQQNVLAQAGAVASAFQQTANGLATLTQNTSQQFQQAVTQVNQLADQLAAYNQQIMAGDQNDAGLDAEIHATIEQLSSYGAIGASRQSDGTWTVLLNGQTPLVIQNRTYAIQAEIAPNSPTAQNPTGPSHLLLADAGGADITADTSAGQLGSLLNLANVVLPGYRGDASQAGSLNTLAAKFVQTVNDLLTNGYQSPGPPPVPGVELFSTASSDPTDAAASLTVNPSISPDQLAAISAGPPMVANGVALALSQLSDPSAPGQEIGGLSYTQYFAGMAADAGRLLDNATSRVEIQQSAVAQAQNVRQQVSGVSLDDEATILMQFQQAYEANSKLITILDQLTEDTINMLPTT